MRGQPARRVRRAGTGKPTAETLHGVPSPTQQVQALDRTAPTLPMRLGSAGEADPRLHPPRHHHAVRRAGDRHRPRRAGLPAAAPPPGVPGLPQAGGQGLPAAEAASGRGQLRHQLVEMPAGDQVCSHDLPGTDRVRSYATCRLCGLTLCGLASRSVLPAGVAQERFALPKVGLPSLAAIAEPPPRFGINRGGR